MSSTPFASVCVSEHQVKQGLSTEEPQGNCFSLAFPSLRHHRRGERLLVPRRVQHSNYQPLSECQSLLQNVSKWLIAGLSGLCASDFRHRLAMRSPSQSSLFSLQGQWLGRLSHPSDSIARFGPCRCYHHCLFLRETQRLSCRVSGPLQLSQGARSIQKAQDSSSQASFTALKSPLDTDKAKNAS